MDDKTSGASAICAGECIGVKQSNWQSNGIDFSGGVLQTSSKNHTIMNTASILHRTAMELYELANSVDTEFSENLPTNTREH